MNPNEQDDPKSNGEWLPAPLTDALDALDREIRMVAVARLLKQHNISPTIAQQIVRGLLCYLHGERDEAVQIFEAVSEDLRDRTVQLG